VAKIGEPLTPILQYQQMEKLPKDGLKISNKIKDTTESVQYILD